MNTDPQPTFLARLARRPFPIFLGLAVGFLGCYVAGRVSARQQPFKNFVRFHIGLAPESHYYPTFSQTLNLARQKAKTGQDPGDYRWQQRDAGGRAARQSRVEWRTPKIAR